MRTNNRCKKRNSLRWRNERRNIVYNITTEDLKKLSQIFTLRSFSIYQQSTSSSASTYQYEVIYTGSKNIFSLLRTADKKLAETHIQQIKNLIPILVAGNTVTKPSICQPVIDTAINNPEWLEHHIAASIGCTAYFTQIKLTPEEINSTVAPGMVTSLQLAISRNYFDTVRAIINLKPDINIKDDEGNNVLHEAACSSIEVLNEVFKMPGIESLFSVENSKGLTPISIACLENKVANLKKFMSFGVPASLLYICAPVSSKNNTVLKYDPKMLSTFDFSNISRGGCPLHWCRDVASFTRELKNGFLPDTVDLDMETPILISIKKSLSKSVICLASNGADVNLSDAQGSTPLHIATRRGDLQMIKSLLVFGSDINQKNAHHETPLHIAASRGSAFENAYKLLVSLRPRACEMNLLESCNKRCLEPSYPACSIIDKCAFNSMSAQKNLYKKAMLKAKPQSQDASNSPKSAKSEDMSFKTAFEKFEEPKNRLLSIDGGGVKGLISIQIMMEIEQMLQYPFHRYFDWYCGTSTGAIIAAALMQNKSLTEIRKMYWHFKDEILSGKKPFDSAKLIKLFKEELNGELAVREVGRLFGKQIMVTATNIRQHPPVLEMFRSFRNHRSIASAQETIPLWEALRASSAAPTFFKSHRKFVDGGLLANNPMLDALTEYCRHRDCLEKENEGEPIQRVVPQLGLALSLGQSRIMPEKNNLVKIYDNLNWSIVNLMRNAVPQGVKYFVCEIVNQIKSLILQTNEYIVNRSEAFATCMGSIFFRISPIIGTKISLDETSDEKLIEALWMVKVYAAKHSTELKEIADLLNALGPAPKIVDDFIDFPPPDSRENNSKLIQQAVDEAQSALETRGRQKPSKCSLQTKSCAKII